MSTTLATPLSLLSPVRIGAWDLPNRVVMAPLTRQRSSPGRVPNALMAEYYRQRAGAGLILSEATSISAQGVGYTDSPGIWSDEQVEGWKLVTRAVHAAGGRIVLQLWHVGRISDPHFLDGELPVAPSAIAAAGNVSQLRPVRPFATPRALRTEEIAGIIADYRRAAENAKHAGFDGVELHGANGYLPEQFLLSGSNTRTDEYGGSVQNRARFILEAIDALISVWGPARVGLHLSPLADPAEKGDANPAESFGHVVREVSKRKIAFVFSREPQDRPVRLSPELRRNFSGAFIVNQNHTLESGEAAIAAGEADAVSYGIPYIANPDLAKRFSRRAPLNPADTTTFYGQGPQGYTDYPALQD